MMFRSDTPSDFDTNSYEGSIKSNGYSTLDETSSQISNLSRLSAKSIYLQRRQYTDSINKMMDKFQYRVEHLFTCDLDGKELRNISDCVERLKLLDQMGRVWGQNMLLEVRGTNLLFKDIETKEELESIPLSNVRELEAVLDAEGFNSLLTLSVQPKNKRTTVFLFQCEEIRADYVQKNLSQTLSQRKEGSGLSITEEKKPSSAPQWIASDYGEGDYPDPELDLAQDEEEEEEPARHREEVPSRLSSSAVSPPKPYTELDRNVDILNHILNDVEIFMGRIAALVAKSANKKKKKKKGKAQVDLAPAEEFAACLHKIKYGFNLLGELKGQISNPGAPEFVHSLFSALAFVASHCPKDLPPTIVAPLLTPQCIRFLSDEASTEEDQLWQSLGDAWNIPSTQWPEDDEDIPTYTLEFTDGWQAPEITAAPEPDRRESPQPAPVRQPSHQTQISTKWKPLTPPQKAHLTESKLCDMRVKYDFISRNQRELTITKGETVQLLDKSRQWWKVRNSRGEEGYVPNNVLGDDDEQIHSDEIIEESPVLTRKSKPLQVKAWLEDKGFSPMPDKMDIASSPEFDKPIVLSTVRCLGGLSGSMLLGMTREELKMVCPEEGGRVFFQLQAVKSALP